MVVAVGAEGKVFTVYAQDRIQQRLVEQITLKFRFLMVVEVGGVFTAFAQDEFLLPHPRTRLVLWMSILSRFFAHPQNQKSARLGPHSGSELSADFSSSTLASQLAHADPWPLVEGRGGI